MSDMSYAQAQKLLEEFKLTIPILEEATRELKEAKNLALVQTNVKELNMAANNAANKAQAYHELINKIISTISDFKISASEMSNTNNDILLKQNETAQKIESALELQNKMINNFASELENKITNINVDDISDIFQHQLSKTFGDLVSRQDYVLDSINKNVEKAEITLGKFSGANNSLDTEVYRASEFLRNLTNYTMRFYIALGFAVGCIFSGIVIYIVKFYTS